MSLLVLVNCWGEFIVVSSSMLGPISLLGSVHCVVSLLGQVGCLGFIFVVSFVVGRRSLSCGDH